MSAEGMRGSTLRWLTLVGGWVWLGAACTPAGEALVLPAPPDGTRSLFLWTAGVARVASVPISDGTLDTLTVRGDQPLGLLYSGASLESLQLEAGALPAGGTREVPGALGVHEYGPDGWLTRARLDDLPVAVGPLRLPPLDPAACKAAGGCSGVLPEPELCVLPCACPRSLAGLEVPWSFAEGCTFEPAPRQQTCYRTPRPFSALNNLGQRGSSADLGQVVQEGPRSVAYFDTNHFAQPLAVDDTLYIYIAKVDLNGPDGVDLATVRHLPIIDVPTPQGPLGWSSAPRIRADGLELFLHSSVPDGNWNDEELFLAHRSNRESDFGPMVAITSLTNSTNAPTVGEAGDEARQPLLFPDFRTLLFRRGDQNGMVSYYARRGTDRTGDVSFLPVEGTDPYRSAGAGYGLSRDNAHLLAAVREGPPETDVTRFYALPITALSPEIRYGDPIALTLPNGTPVELPDPWWDMLITEHPDGSAIYVSKNGVTWILDAAPCE